MIRELPVLLIYSFGYLKMLKAWTNLIRDSKGFQFNKVLDFRHKCVPARACYIIAISTWGISLTNCLQFIICLTPLPSAVLMAEKVLSDWMLRWTYLTFTDASLSFLFFFAQSILEPLRTCDTVSGSSLCGYNELISAKSMSYWHNYAAIFELKRDRIEIYSICLQIWF